MKKNRLASKTAWVLAMLACTAFLAMELLLYDVSADAAWRQFAGALLLLLLVAGVALVAAFLMIWWRRRK